MTRETIAAAIFVWLIGAVVGWFAGWIARGEQNRGWQANLGRQLGATRAQLAEALDQLDAAHLRDDHGDATRVPPPPVVHVHVAPALPWGTPQPAVGPWVVGSLPASSTEVITP